MNMFNSSTITILNKLSAKDNINKQDEWYKTEINNCVWVNKAISNLVDTQSEISQITTVRIPASNNYKPYKEWLKSPNLSFTISLGDYIVLGNVEEEVITNINSIINKYEPNIIRIKSIKDNSRVEIIMPHYRIEGN